MTPNAKTLASHPNRCDSSVGDRTAVVYPSLVKSLVQTGPEPWYSPLKKVRHREIRVVKEGEMGRRILNDALRTIVNAERRKTATAKLQPISTVMVSFLKIMKDRGYIKDFQVFDPHRVGRITVELLGRINDCRVLTYRQDIKAKDIEQYRLRALPTRQWGYVVITTPNGVLDHEEAIRQKVGGQVLGFFH